MNIWFWYCNWNVCKDEKLDTQHILRYFFKNRKILKTTIPYFFITQKLELKNWAAASCFRFEASAVQIEIALGKVRFTHLKTEQKRKLEKWNVFLVSDEILSLMEKKKMGLSCGYSVFWIVWNGEESTEAGNHESLVDTSINAFWRQHFWLKILSGWFLL